MILACAQDDLRRGRKWWIVWILALVVVVKLRHQFTSEKYTAEFAEVRIAGGATSETVEIESDDPAAVLRAIAKLGLNSHANINYVRHLKLMTGMTPRASATAT